MLPGPNKEEIPISAAQSAELKVVDEQCLQPIENMVMLNDLNNALGSFNPGQQTRGKANGKKQKQFYGGKRGNGKVGRQEATTSLLSYKSNTGLGHKSDT